MDVQAYFEEWSRLPGETVRMAISSRHESVRATLERITRGPTKEDTDGAFRSFGVPIPGVDITVPGVEQPTAIGSCAELPLGGRLRTFVRSALLVSIRAFPTGVATGRLVGDLR